MLAIVADPSDAAQAAQAGVDRVAIDKRGGPSSHDAWVGFVARTGTPVSLLLGDEALDQREAAAWLRHMTAIESDEVRLPMKAESGVLVPILAASGHRVIATVSAAHAADDRVLDRAVTLGVAGIMVAGPAASGRRLLDDLAIPRLSALVEACRARGLTVALSGALEGPDVPRLLALHPDELAFDRAMRSDLRAQGPLDPEALRVVRDLMRSGGVDPASPAVAGPDRIFVRDWVLSMSIGAYAGERDAPQRVRVSVEAEIERRAGRTADLRDVVSYDLITDAIRRLVAAHVDLVETLAEQIAEAVLTHHRVMGVTVTVEKLDLGPGAVGCRISRRR